MSTSFHAFTSSLELRRPTLPRDDCEPWHSTLRSSEKVSPAMSNNRLIFVVYHCLNIYQLSVRWVYSLSLELIACIHVHEFHLFYVPFISFHHVLKSQMTIQFTPLWNCLRNITIAASRPLATLSLKLLLRLEIIMIALRELIHITITSSLINESGYNLLTIYQRIIYSTQCQLLPLSLRLTRRVYFVHVCES